MLKTFISKWPYILMFGVYLLGMFNHNGRLGGLMGVSLGVIFGFGLSEPNSKTKVITLLLGGLLGIIALASAFF